MSAQTGDLPPVGLNLRRIRQGADLSLSQAAEQTGVSKAMLGQIERGESSPTLATLWKLANGFNIPLTSLITQPTDKRALFDPQFQKHEHIDEAIRFQTVFSYDPEVGSETFLHDIQPGQTHLSQPHLKGVIEDVFVIFGEIEILHDGSWHSVNAGSALRFAADQPHGYRNVTDTPARFHNVMHYTAIS